VDVHGQPKLTDFGLALRIAAEQTPEGIEGHLDSLTSGRLTHTGEVVGTPAYMAPEQAAGDPRKVSPASDVWCLGATLYEMLTGRSPFRGETVAETLFQLMHHDPEPPTRLNAQVPRPLEAICLKCLRKDPKDRYASAEDMADDLRHFIAGRRPSVYPPLWRRIFRRGG
jgi:serine/threonine-protein kinase